MRVAAQMTSFPDLMGAFCSRTFRGFVFLKRHIFKPLLAFYEQGTKVDSILSSKTYAVLGLILLQSS
jgi:hypothetical protein